MDLPPPRGPVSGHVIDALRRDNDEIGGPALGPHPVTTDPDVQLALWILYELHYRGFGNTIPTPSGIPTSWGCAVTSNCASSVSSVRRPVNDWPGGAGTTTSPPSCSLWSRMTRPRAGRLPAPSRDPRADAGFPPRAQCRAAQGVRSPGLYAPPPGGTSEGGPRRDPVPRVRGWPTRAPAPEALRRRAGSGRTRCELRRIPAGRLGRLPGVGERHVDVRSAPEAAGCRRWAVRRVRGHQLGALTQDRRGPRTTRLPTGSGGVLPRARRG